MSPTALLETLRARGVRLEARGDRLRIEAPAGALTRGLRALLIEQKPALLRLLVQPGPAEQAPGAAAPPQTVVRSGAYSFPWPDAVSGLGPRTMGPFDLCEACARGSWVRYGATVLCLACARDRAEADPVDPRRRVREGT